jgi:hypothetical protein
MYTHTEEPRIPWLVHNQDRASKWAMYTGYGADKSLKLVDVQEAYGMGCRIGLELLLERHVNELASHTGLGLGRRALSMSPKELREAVTTSAVEPFVKVALPLIRRLYIQLYARSLCTVWPMTTPEAKIFYIDHRYASTKYPTTANDRLDQAVDPNYSGWGESPESFTGDGVTTTFVVETTAVKTTASAGAFSSSRVRVFVNGVEKTHTTDFTVDNGGANGRGRVIFGVAPALNAKIKVMYATYAEGDTPRELDMKMTSETLTATDMTLRFLFTEQSRQDFGAYHNGDLEQEMVDAASNQLDREIDRQLVRMMLVEAAMNGAGNVNWSTAGYLAGDIDTASRLAYEATLGQAIIKADQMIWKATNGNARANWLIAGSDAAERLRLISGFRQLDSSVDRGGIGVSNTATLEKRILFGTVNSGTTQVYMDPFMPASKILLGYKADNPMYMAAVFAPYSLLTWTPTMPDPSANFQYSKGVLSRAGKKCINAKAFATVTLT